MPFAIGFCAVWLIFQRETRILLVGPVFTREFAITPRRGRVYVARAAYSATLVGLVAVAWLMLTGTQLIRDLGDLARFGTLLFQILCPLQMVVAIFFSALLAASAVSQEKDRRTMILLLMTNLSNSELVLGKLFASLLHVLVLLASAIPIFMLIVLLGGVSVAQVVEMVAVTFAAVLVCGSLGALVAFWREKTFQALSISVMAIVLWIGFWEVVASGVLGTVFAGLSAESWAAAMSPWRAILATVVPMPESLPVLGPIGTPAHLFLLVSLVGATVINGLTIAMVRVWNPSREARRSSPDEQRTETIWGVGNDIKDNQPLKGGDALKSDESVQIGSVRGVSKTRAVWDNPILWREIRTWAYGRKILLVRLVYLVLFALVAAALYTMVGSEATFGKTEGALTLVPLFLLSLFLINAQAVTSITSERDVRAMDLLLVTDLSASEIVFGKLGGVLYNTKEMILLPILLCAWLWSAGGVGFENFIYLMIAWLVMVSFASMLGVHAGMNYFNSRAAVAVSLGTLFFLFVGVATCMRMMVAFSGSFQAQLQPFLAFTVGGGIGLYWALGARNPSPAIGMASFLCPFATFYAITSYLLGYTLAVLLATVSAYGFMIAAMMVPAIYEFDVATGRTTLDE
jgi:ABC-type transport system involved in multi-copper enzyme maturation permease subunit